MSNKTRNTALVLIQPFLLVNDQERRARDGYLRSFEDFVSEAKKKGAYVVYLSYAGWLWWRLIELADICFVIGSGFIRFEQDEICRKLSRDDKKFLLGLGSKNKFFCGDKDPPEGYKHAARSLSAVFAKHGIGRILVCGGFDNQCMNWFVMELKDRSPTLNIYVSSAFLARDTEYGAPLEDINRGFSYFEKKDGDSKALLKWL